MFECQSFVSVSSEGPAAFCSDQFPLVSLHFVDGAEYLKEILPLFFVHHKMRTRRLCRIVHRLPHNGRKRNGGTSQLKLSELHQKIDTWVTSATAGQIRQLPAVMKKAGATKAANNLENKLRRMDSQLAELCALRNEVDVAYTSGQAVEK